MRRLTGVLMIASGLATACGGVSAASDTGADVAQVKALESTVHKAQTSKNVDLLMSIWDEDATLTAPGKTYTALKEIRDYWAMTAPVFKPENNWIELTATFRNTASVHGDQGTFHFECYFLDIPTMTVKGVSVFESTVVRRDDRWLLKAVTVAPLAKLSASG